ncbi:redoxin domain-containing protein [Aureibaculum sp. 2210JD6-5]|uniref:TlpA disulfide reductase family protein n=1 Tax=Aureibaculum sp. 2210JD6-5 TaxID=3103957 RepID=UPI002AAD4588|nr:redoxin domain-containing protein [Aureibaculum sp. 2210JD6-5]MDY7394711.1 redoxin domain-containing protein [Aureibaculum sp. 2210JD6-5]
MRKVLVVIGLLIVFSSKAQQKIDVANQENDSIEIYNFSQLEPILNANDDSTYVINFWATWCGPCIKELPYFEELYTNYKDKKVKVILVSLDFPEKFESKLIPFVKKHKVSPQVILLDDPNENEWIPKVDESWSGALPATIIYNKNKRAFFEQSFTQESLNKTIKEFL